jgi:hypothetical protein
MFRTVLLALVLTAAVLALPSCDSADDDPADTNTVFVIEVAEAETFRVRLAEPAQIREAERLIDTGQEQVLTGTLRRGDGGFNAPYSWHLAPETVEFVDVTIEVCDGLPSFVESDLDYWVDTVGTYCPWSSQVVGREAP